MLAALAFALAGAGCTSSMSLGAAGTPDGGDAMVMTSTGGSDAAVDRPPDVATDVPLDQNIDAQAVTCVENGVTYHVGDVIPRGGNGCLMSCLCLASGTVGYCTGVACPVDGAVDGTVDSRAIDPINTQRCLKTGGVPSASLCCPGTGDFPDTCAVGVCTCSPATSHTIDTCVCPNGGCYQATLGCVGRANVCTVGADQTCNDDLSINSLHGTCLTGGRCACNAGFTLVPASGKCS